MAKSGTKRGVAVTVRFPSDDLRIIDRAAAFAGETRGEFVRRASVRYVQTAILCETQVRLSPAAFDQFCAAIDAPVEMIPAKLAERLARTSPWDADRAE